jgi:archaellum component FlaC
MNDFNAHDLYQQIGRHAAKIDGIKEDLDDIRKSLKHIESIVDQAKGGWKSMVAVGTIIAAIASFVTAMWHQLINR